MNFAIGAIGGTGGTSGAGGTAEHRRLADAAQQFEGMLMQEMLKPLREHGLSGDDGEDARGDKDGSGFEDTLSSYGVEAMATAIAKQGGLGVARLVVAQVEGERSRAGVGDGRGIAAPK